MKELHGFRKIPELFRKLPAYDRAWPHVSRRDFREFYEEICKFDDVAELKDDIWYDHFLPLLTEFYDKNGRLPYPSEDLKAVRFIEKHNIRKRLNFFSGRLKFYK